MSSLRMHLAYFVIGAGGPSNNHEPAGPSAPTLPTHAGLSE